MTPSPHRLGLEPDQHPASPEARLVLNPARKIDTTHPRRIPQMKDDPRFAALRICHAARSIDSSSIECFDAKNHTSPSSWPIARLRLIVSLL
jgi:hypothetical protein